ncbi:MAG: C1 family peptidase [Bacteroidota bacterium]
MKKLTSLGIAFFIISFAIAQKDKTKRDKGIFVGKKSGYYVNTIMKDLKNYENSWEKQKDTAYFKIDSNSLDVPNKIELYKTVWTNPPIAQGNSGTCWCFSTTSFLEAEIFRLTKQKVKLSELYVVYWEYVEKARRYVRERGNSNFDEGSEANAVTRLVKLYGIVPAESYTGLKKGQPFHNHDKMVGEMKSYLNSVKERNAWNEDEVIETIKAIMNNYIEKPPTTITYNGKQITPDVYVKNVLSINLDNYVEVLSLKEPGYWKKVEYEVPDNWWHSEDYYNVPLDIFMNILKESIKKGYSCSIGGDVSEAGFNSWGQSAVIPTFDIPSEYIDEDARQFRFSNKTTTDDHGMHLVGYYEKDGVTWYLIRDSGAGSRNCGKDSKSFGYYFFSEDFVKLKMTNFTVHKDMISDIIKKFGTIK